MLLLQHEQAVQRLQHKVPVTFAGCIAAKEAATLLLRTPHVKRHGFHIPASEEGLYDHLARAAGGVGGEEATVGGDAAPVLADGAAAEHGLGREADKDLHESVVAQSVDASVAST
jgi:hypothetical protein